ncbi:MAG: hypothetical protein ABI910_05770 [Gemmatimonadota bacterium]
MHDTSRSTPEQAPLAELPPGLSALLAREIAAGNAIEHIGGGHPATPIGACIMLARGLASSDPFPDGVRHRVRSSSLYTDEITEGAGHYFILTPPGPPPEMPDMDAIRAQHSPLEWTPPTVHPAPADERIELDIRGETLVYHAGGRHVYVEWTYTMGNRLSRSSLSMRHGPEKGMSERMTLEEADRVFARILALAPGVLGTSDLIIVP